MKREYLYVLFLFSHLCAGICIGQEIPMLIKSPGKPFVSLENRQGSPNESAGVDLPAPGGINSSFRFAAAKALPGVVHIITEYDTGFKELKDYGLQKGVNPMGLSQPVLEPAAITGSASGVIITPDGYVVTNYHVVWHAKSLDVVLANGLSFKARVIGIDSLTDLALLKINGQQLPFVHFGSIDAVAVGDWVLAIGSPLGMNSTVTAGIVSAKSRLFASQEEQGKLSSFIQTDAVMNSGNSGGALVDMYGKLIGINIGILTPTGNFAGYSFAIPVEVVEKVCNDLLREGKTERSSMGVYITNVSGMQGVLIYKLVDKGAAAMGGLRVQDIIKEIDNREVRSVGDIQQTMVLHHPGDKIQLKVLRNGSLVICEVILSNA